MHIFIFFHDLRLHYKITALSYIFSQVVKLFTWMNVCTLDPPEDVEAEHASSRTRKLPTILNLYKWAKTRFFLWTWLQERRTNPCELWLHFNIPINCSYLLKKLLTLAQCWFKSAPMSITLFQPINNVGRVYSVHSPYPLSQCTLHLISGCHSLHSHYVPVKLYTRTSPRHNIHFPIGLSQYTRPLWYLPVTVYTPSIPLSQCKLPPSPFHSVHPLSRCHSVHYHVPLSQCTLALSLCHIVHPPIPLSQCTLPMSQCIYSPVPLSQCTFALSMSKCTLPCHSVHPPYPHVTVYTRPIPLSQCTLPLSPFHSVHSLYPPSQCTRPHRPVTVYTPPYPSVTVYTRPIPLSQCTLPLSPCHSVHSPISLCHSVHSPYPPVTVYTPLVSLSQCTLVLPPVSVYTPPSPFYSVHSLYPPDTVYTPPCPPVTVYTHPISL